MGKNKRMAGLSRRGKPTLDKTPERLKSSKTKDSSVYSIVASELSVELRNKEKKK